MILVDAHVHIYDCFELDKFLDAAYSNFKSAADRLLGHNINDFTGILLLAEASNDNWFHHLSSLADGERLPGNGNIGNWKFYRTDERCSLHARSDDNRELFIIAGRQFVTLEGLEVLSIASTNSFPEGLPIKKLIANVRDTGGIPVIPWGFGKWMGRRGAILNKLLDTAKSADFFLGDSGNRPFFIPYPSQLNRAQNRNLRNLPGSDPLPFHSGHKKPGSFGFSLSEPMDKSKPAAYLKKMIGSIKTELRSYGEPIGLFGFFRNQILLQLRKIYGKINKNN